MPPSRCEAFGLGEHRVVSGCHMSQRTPLTRPTGQVLKWDKTALAANVVRCGSTAKRLREVSALHPSAAQRCNRVHAYTPSVCPQPTIEPLA